MLTRAPDGHGLPLLKWTAAPPFFAAILVWLGGAAAGGADGGFQPPRYDEATGPFTLRMEVLDAQAFSPLMGPPSLSRDPAGTPLPQATLGFDPHPGAVLADGASMLVIRVQLPGNLLNPPLTVKLRDMGAANKNDPAFIGSLSAPPQTNPWMLPAVPAPDPANGAQVGSLTQAAFAGANNTYYVFYRPPNNFMFGNQTVWDPLTFEAFDSAGNFVGFATVWLLRPPLILAHGINSSPKAFDPFLDGLNALNAGPNGLVLYTHKFDWSRENTSGYDTAAAILRGWIQLGLIPAYRRGHCAATRFDYFGHSMGGVIAKWYAAAPPAPAPGVSRAAPLIADGQLIPGGRERGFARPIIWVVNANNAYLRNANFGAGDFHRVITIGAPLHGSPIADWTRHNGRGWCRVVLGPAAPLGILAGAHGDSNCYSDLGTTSAATTILTVGQAGVQWYPIVGYAAPRKGLSSMLIHTDGLAAAVDALFDSTDFLHLGISQNGAFANWGLWRSNSDMVVRDRSQLDLPTDAVDAASLWYYNRPQNRIVPLPNAPPPVPPPGLDYEPMRNATHNDELTDPALPRYVEGVLDLQYANPPALPAGDWLYFNPTF